jgi:hypothetical protein
MNFDSGYFGKIFSVCYSGEKGKGHSRESMHVLTSATALEIYSPDFRERVVRILPDQVTSVVPKGGVLTVTYKDGKSTSTLRLESPKLDALARAVQPIPAGKAAQKQGIAATAILPLIDLPPSAIPQTMAALTKFTDRLLNVFESQSEAGAWVIDVVACAFVARFLKCKGRQSPGTFQDELRLRWTILWIRALLKATSFTDINREYIARMVIHLANTIAILCEPQDIGIKELMSACVYFYEERNPIGIVKESEKLELTIQEKLASLRCKDDCEGDTLIEALYDIAILAICGRIVNIYSYDLEVLRDMCVARVSRDDPATPIMRQLAEAANTVISDMLRRMADKRYDRGFQYVFALWPFHETQ